MSDSPTPGRRGPGRPGYDQQAVLRQAVDLFIRQGYDATSMADVAKELGFTKAAIYHHFASKSDLLAQALDEALAQLEASIARVRADHELTAYERLRMAVVVTVEVLIAHLAAATLLLRVRGNSEVELAALNRRRRIDHDLTLMVREAADEGALRTDLPPDLISRLLFGMVNSLTEWVRPDGRYDAHTIAEALTVIAFDGLTNQTRPHSS
jgi:AcrR family transcriptional regulator